jgi:hypothetical protein
MLAEASLEVPSSWIIHNSPSEFKDDEWLLAVLLLALSSYTSSIHGPRDNFESPDICSRPLCGSIGNSPAIEFQSVTLMLLSY